MKDNTKKILLGAGIVAFIGAAATGGYFFAKMTGKDSDKDSDSVSSYSDADDMDEEDYAEYNFSEMTNYITLGDYKNVKVNRFVPTLDDVDEETVESDMEYYMEDYREFSEVKDRAAKEGDTLTIDYTVAINGEDIDELSAEEFEFVLGDEEFLPELEKKLIGVKSGETLTAEVTHPSDFEYEEYADKKATYNITVSSITECTYEPELTDQFVKDKIDGCETLEDWKKVLRQEELESLQEEAEEQVSADVYNAALAATSFSDYEGLLKAYPSLYEDVHDEIISEYEYSAEMFGMTADEYMKEFAQMTDDDIDNEVKDHIKGEIMIYAIIEKEGLTLTDEEFNSFVDENYEAYECESAEEFIEYYSRESIEDACLYQKCTDFLIKNADITEISYEEYSKLMYSEDEATDTDAEFEIVPDEEGDDKLDDEAVEIELDEEASDSDAE